jgi:hypothetical protein
MIRLVVQHYSLAAFMVHAKIQHVFAIHIGADFDANITEILVIISIIPSNLTNYSIQDIISISPTSGPDNHNTLVQIVGTNFYGNKN